MVRSARRVLLISLLASYGAQCETGFVDITGMVRSARRFLIHDARPPSASSRRASRAVATPGMGATPRRRAEKRETTLSDDVSTAVVDAGEDVRGKK